MKTLRAGSEKGRMIIKKKKPEEETTNPYNWPENYYMETDPKVRRAILTERMRVETDGDLEKRKRLFEQRYTLDCKKEYKDNFIKACLDLLYLASNLGRAFGAKSNRKQAEKIIRLLCLDHVDEYGTEILYEELCHAIKVYITIAMDDAAYRSVILKVVKMNDERCIEKIKSDLNFFSHVIPESLGMEEEFGLFKKAVLDTQKDYL